MTKPTPFLIWVGGKKRHLPHYTGLIPAQMQSYCEPFLGGGSLFFHLQPDRAVLADSNGELINTYRHLRESPNRLITALHYEAKNLEERGKDYYLLVRDQFNTDMGTESIEQAARFILLNKAGYGGLYRVSAKSGFNVPYGNRPKPVICDEANLMACHRALAKPGVIILNLGFESSLGFYKTQLIESAGPGLVFADPPYVKLHWSSFTGYQLGGFTWDDQKKLADTLCDTACAVIACNSPGASSLYPRPLGWTHTNIIAARAIGVSGKGRESVGESIFSIR